MSDIGELATIIHDSATPSDRTYTILATEAAHDVLAAGYRKPRQITTVEELDALTDGSAILDIEEGDVGQKVCGWWHFPETARMGSSKVMKYGHAVTVLYTPEPSA